MSEKKHAYNYDTELKQLSSLEEKKIQVSIETITGYRNIIKIKINNSLIKSDLIDKEKEIVFILLIKYNHPLSSPLLFCITKFSIPELSDGRDFLEDVLEKPWIPQKKYILKKIINSIPKFINNYLKNISEQNDLKSFGKYYLDYNYELNTLKMFPHLYFGDIIEIVALGNDKKVCDEKRIIMITEGFILLFVEKSIFEAQKLKLIFWGSIKALSIIKQLQIRDVIELKWKARKEKTNLMRIKTQNNQKIFDILMDCLTKKKIEYKVATESSGVKKGELPQIDIVAVEQEISKLEIKLKIRGKEGSNVENTKQLMNLYEKAIQYYSAVNDYKYQIYMRKTKKLFTKMGDKELGIKKKSGEKKKGKKGKLKKEKSQIEEEKKEEKKEIKKDEKKEEIKETKKEEEKENIKKGDENKEINNDKIENIIEKKEENEEKKIEDKKEQKKEESVNIKKEEKKEQKAVEKKEEKKEEKKIEENANIKEEEKKEKKVDEKEEEKKEEEKNEKEKEEKSINNKNQNETKENKEKNDNQNKGEDKSKSEARKKYENSGLDLDLDLEDD